MKCFRNSGPHVCKLLVLYTALLISGCKAGNPETSTTREFPSPVLDKQQSNNTIPLASLTSFTVSGRCAGNSTAIEYSVDNSTWSSLPGSEFNCKNDGTFQINSTDLPPSTRTFYVRARGKGTVVSRATFASLVLDAGALPPSNTKFAVAAASGVVSGATRKVKFAIGYNMPMGDGSNAMNTVHSSSSGVLNEQ